jgi:hypothetical protein
MPKLKWVKLATGYLRDEKIHYIIKKYGHDSMVFWTGLLTECDRGVLQIDEDIFAEILVMDTQRFAELKKIFSDPKFGLIEVNDEGKIQVVKWEEYQYSESYGRVTKHRATKSSNGLVTPLKQNVTVDKDKEEDKEEDREVSKTNRQILDELKRVKGYPYKFETDLELIERLTNEFPKVDVLSVVKKWATGKYDKPLKKNSNPRLQIRNWVEKQEEWRKEKQPVQIQPPTEYDPIEEIRKIMNGG